MLPFPTASAIFSFILVAMAENGNPTMRSKLGRAALHTFRLLVFAMVVFLVLFHAGVA
jgi:hypothetical protein